jgi:hypothetical protein
MTSRFSARWPIQKPEDGPLSPGLAPTWGKGVSDIVDNLNRVEVAA